MDSKSLDSAGSDSAISDSARLDSTSLDSTRSDSARNRNYHLLKYLRWRYCLPSCLEILSSFVPGDIVFLRAWRYCLPSCLEILSSFVPGDIVFLCAWRYCLPSCLEILSSFVPGDIVCLPSCPVVPELSTGRMGSQGGSDKAAVSIPCCSLVGSEDRFGSGLYIGSV